MTLVLTLCLYLPRPSSSPSSSSSYASYELAMLVRVAVEVSLWLQESVVARIALRYPAAAPWIERSGARRISVRFMADYRNLIFAAVLTVVLYVFLLIIF